MHSRPRGLWLHVPLATVAAFMALLTAPSAQASPRSGVAALQVVLRDRGYYRYAVDGLLGPQTVTAVRHFQQRRGLIVDGIPGLQTRRALGRYARHRLGERPLFPGTWGWDVSEAQFLLRLRGASPGRLDASFGPKTEAAVRLYQRRAALVPDGVVGPATVASLDGITLTGSDAGGHRRKQRRHKIILVRTEAHRLYLYRPHRAMRVFTVATGSIQRPTPRGRFRIISMARHPWWYPPDSRWAHHLQPIPPGPGNPLGTRWMGISVPGVGIHGTPDAASLGYSASHGCVRMRIADAEWLFQHVRIGTPVSIS